MKLASTLRSAKFGAPLVALFLLIGGTVLGLDITASISGNTVNYNVSGTAANSDYTVIIEHDTTGQGNTYDKKSDENGSFSGSGTPGNSEIKPGDSVTVKVKDKDGNQIGSKTVQKDRPKAPWWAYTGIGTLVYLLAN